MKGQYISLERFPCRGKQSKHLAPRLNMKDLVQEVKFIQLLTTNYCDSC